MNWIAAVWDLLAAAHVFAVPLLAIAFLVFAFVILLSIKSTYSAINVVGWMSVTAGICLLAYGVVLSRRSTPSGGEELLPTDGSSLDVQ